LNQGIQILEAGIRHISEIRELAHLVWHACYPGIITIEQVRYMLERGYEPEILKKEIERENIIFERLLSKGTLIGFASHGPTGTEGETKIHKLYIHPEHHRQGHGGSLLKHIAGKRRAEGISTLVLAVNKRNTQAIQAYRKNKFRIREEVVVDIGGGFLMDDYIMEKPLHA